MPCGVCRPAWRKSWRSPSPHITTNYFRRPERQCWSAWANDRVEINREKGPPKSSATSEPRCWTLSMLAVCETAVQVFGWHRLPMTIRNDDELEEAVTEVSILIQKIQDYAGRDFSKPAKVRFPRGYLRTAAESRRRVSFLEDATLRSNIAYTIQLSDVQHWILCGTDLSGMAKEMVIKLQIFLLGTIVESVTKNYLRGRCGGNFCRRTEYLLDKGQIDVALKADIDWLWDIRNNMHLFQLDDIEWTSANYTVANHNRAVRAFRRLLVALGGS